MVWLLSQKGWEEKEIDVAGEDLCYLTEKQMPFLKDKSYTNMSQFWNVIKKVMVGNVVIDGRNIYDRQELEKLGFVYTRIGEK